MRFLLSWPWHVEAVFRKDGTHVAVEVEGRRSRLSKPRNGQNQQQPHESQCGRLRPQFYKYGHFRILSKMRDPLRRFFRTVKSSMSLHNTLECFRWIRSDLPRNETLTFVLL